MDLLQTWIVIGVPGLLTAAVLFVGHSTIRAVAGYVVLSLTLLAFVLLPGDAVSASVIGLLMVILVANGHGQAPNDDLPEHHENRERFTVAEH